MPYLRTLPVTRLPSFRFLLSYSIIKEAGIGVEPSGYWPWLGKGFWKSLVLVGIWASWGAHGPDYPYLPLP